MIAYFDSSAIVPLLIAEPGSELAASLWDSSDRVTSVRLFYPETRAALARAQRLGRLTARSLRAAVGKLDALLEEMDLVEVDDVLARRAGDLSEARRLRGYDAVHLAAAERVQDPTLILVAGDASLLEAGEAEGIAIAQIPDDQPRRSPSWVLQATGARPRLGARSAEEPRCDG